MVMQSGNNRGLRMTVKDNANSKSDINTLIEKAQQGDNQAFSELANMNLSLIHSFVNKNADKMGSYNDKEDLLQEGYIGFLHALSSYDPEKGAALSTHGYLWIKQRIDRFVYKNSGSIKLSGINMRLLAGILKLREEGKNDQEICESLQITQVKMNQLSRAKLPMLTTSPEEANEKQRIIDGLIAEGFGVEEEAIQGERIAVLKTVIGKLEPKDQEIISIKWGLSGRGELSYDQLVDTMSKKYPEDKWSKAKMGKRVAHIESRLKALVENQSSHLTSLPDSAKAEDRGLDHVSGVSMFSRASEESVDFEHQDEFKNSAKIRRSS